MEKDTNTLASSIEFPYGESRHFKFKLKFGILPMCKKNPEICKKVKGDKSVMGI